MRFKSDITDGYQIFAVSGVNTVSFAIDASAADTNGLLGFAVERIDPQDDEHYFMPGFKVFRSVIPEPDTKTSVSTFDHPVQSFVWDDFTAKPDYAYTYLFHPLKGKARNLDRTATAIGIKVATEPLFDKKAAHQVFFNRGVASSQAYARRFGNKKPDDLSPEKRQEALDWLSRDLDEAILAFIAAAKSGDTLLCCFYEFRYEAVARALKTAIDDGVNVSIIVDAKVNESTDKKGKFHESFPRVANLEMIKTAELPKSSIILREARADAIAHNKFMVLLKGQQKQPREVWTGSTNISVGGIFGQTNVGHWVRDKDVAALFEEYWNVLSEDPGAADGDATADVRRKNKELRESVEAIGNIPEKWEDVPQGTTPVFSPRSGTEVLEMYAKMVDDAKKLSCITLAFGVNNEFKEQMKDNTSSSHIAFFLLEKKDQPNPRSKQPFIAINAKNNVYMAWGSYMKDRVHQWARETSTRGLQLNEHVAYIHSKFLLMDPLSADPIVVTGSANFSDPSQKDNDENMIIVRGDQRVADIYLTEFNRLFNHYYFRSVTEALHDANAATDTQNSLFLDEEDKAGDWLKKYLPGKFRAKRVQVFKDMEGFAGA
jgi:phosphatidylserine/phosphatidylglycerophosphate/cardiolipin synthase-like enzyme